MCSLCVIIAAMQEHGVTKTGTGIRREVGQQPISFHHPRTIWVIFWFGDLLPEWRKVKLSGQLLHYGWDWSELPSFYKDESYIDMSLVFVNS
jgi:hypothetical protein